MEQTVPKPVYKKDPPGTRFVRAIRQFWPLYLMLIPGMLFFAVYKYAPMYGIQIAFKNFSLKKGISGSLWLWEDGKEALCPRDTDRKLSAPLFKLGHNLRYLHHHAG